jgi:hypothetical protein
MSIKAARTLALLALLACATATARAEEPCHKTVASDPVPADQQKSVGQILDELIPTTGARLSLGSFTGFEGTIFLTKNKNVNVAIEGFWGAAPLAIASGGGTRLELKAVGGEKNALLIAPGLDVYYSGPQPGFFGHSDRQIEIAPNVDVKWLHQFAKRFGIELGLRGGYVYQTSLDQDSKRSAPTLQLISGLRF